MDNLTETTSTALLANVSQTDIAAWTDEKRNDFCKVFKSRVEVAKYILEQTAAFVWAKAHDRQFVSHKHVHKAFGGGYITPGHHITAEIGGRHYHTLVDIAEQRAQEVIQNLPSLKTAVSIIDVETAKKIQRKEEILKEGQAYQEKLEAASGTINMADLDASMTIGAFRTMVKKQMALRDRLINKMNELREEGGILEKQICKALYAGLPGLSDAIVKVVIEYRERAIALDEVGRRIEEKVKFGDSAAAVDLLKHFEQDEVTIPSDVAKKFKDALLQLKLSKTPELKAKSKKKTTKKAVKKGKKR